MPTRPKDLADQAASATDVAGADVIPYDDITADRTKGGRVDYIVQAALRDAALVDDLDMGSNAITNVGNVDGVDVSALDTEVSANTSKLAGIEAGADVTDAANVAAAGALMADGSADLTGDLSVDALVTIDGRDLSVDGAKLDTIEENADVTDTANVTSAGALMRTGGEMSGNITFAGSQTVDGVDVSTLPGLITARLALAGGTMSGPIAMGSQNITGAGSVQAANLRATTGTGTVDVGPSGTGTLTLSANGSAKLTITNTGVVVNTSSLADTSNRQLGPGAPRPVTSGTSTTAAVTDHGRGIDITSTAGAHTLTVPSLAAGTKIPVHRRTTSTVTLSASGVTLSYDTSLFAGTIATSGSILLDYLSTTVVRVVGGLDLA